MCIGALSVVVLAEGCHGPRPAPTAVAPGDGTGVAASSEHKDAPPAHVEAPTKSLAAIDPRPPLSNLLDRDPRGDERCAPPFASYWTLREGAPADLASLAAVAWLDADAEHDGPLVAPSDPKAELARCFAAGPHRGLNLASWCCRPGSTERTVPPPDGAAGLVATLSAGRTVVLADRDLIVAVAVVNRAGAPLPLDWTVLSSAQLALEVQGAAAEPQHTMPPPTPPAQPDVVSLPPGGGRTVQHRLGMFSPPLAPGSYRVRVRAPGIASGSLPFQIVAP